MIDSVWVYIGICLAGLGGFWQRSLSMSGAIAAVITGIAVYFGQGFAGLFLLGVFFVTSSSWSKFKRSEKSEMEERLAKGSIRDWRQVAANGGAAALFSILYYFFPNIVWLIGFAVSIASSNSDTWASEIGSLSKRKPIYIRTFKPIEKGTSGAISLLGTMAAVLGSSLIAVCAVIVFHLDFFYFLMIFLFGFFGNLLDTLIGAFYQKVYVCQKCGIETEKSVHCRSAAIRIKGIPLVDNDMVNFVSGFFASLLAMAVIFLINL